MKTLSTAAAIAVLLGSAQALFSSNAAHAGLGEPDSSIDTDIKIVQGEVRGSTAHDGYTVYEIKTASRTMREYVTAQGKIFAIAWEGLNHPDLTRLLGNYSVEFKTALQATPRRKVRLGHAIFRTANSDLYVETSGHMGGNLRGKAYLMSFKPKELSIDEIR